MPMPIQLKLLVRSRSMAADLSWNCFLRWSYSLMGKLWWEHGMSFDNIYKLIWRHFTNLNDFSVACFFSQMRSNQKQKNINVIKESRNFGRWYFLNNLKKLILNINSSASESKINVCDLLLPYAFVNILFLSLGSSVILCFISVYRMWAYFR